MAKLFFKLFEKPVRIPPEKMNNTRDNLSQGPKIPIHFQKNAIVTYSQAEIEEELQKYPGLLKTLGHAYEYQITVTSNDNQKDYWFCRNIQYSTPLSKYLNEQGWSVDWKEKPFEISRST